MPALTVYWSFWCGC